MTKLRKSFLWLLLILLVAAPFFIVPTVWFKPWSIDHFYARVFITFAMKHPMLLSQLGMLDGTPFDFYSDKLDDMSVAFQLKEARFLDQQIAILKSYDRKSLSENQRLSADVLDWFMSDQQEGNRFMFYDYPVNQLFGVQSGLPDFMMNTHPLKRPKDAANYVARVSRFGTAFDEVIEGLALRERKGVVPPRFVLDEVLAQMKGFVGVPPRENPLFETFARKTRDIKGLEAAKRAELETGLEREIRNTVYPAYERLIRFCTHLDSVATTDDGVWKFPDGDAYYAHCLKSNTTTELPADSIHALGLAEVARIQQQMRAILAAEGYPTADLPAAMARIRAEPRFHFANGDSGRAQIIAAYQSILDDADRKVRALFDVRPKFGVRVERVPAFMEATSPGAYYQAPSIGGARPGTFFVNLGNPMGIARPDMRTLAYHEGIPGHHFQIAIAQELKGVPFFRRIVPFTAYVEGWGLYAERLALEHGFQQDAYDSLGALGAELFRAVRLVVDTGIHRKRWTRQQAIDYMVKNTGKAEPEVVTEVERYIVNPGQACAYKVGQLEILELRQRAMDRLGSRFDLKRFHDVVVTHGALPLGILERLVEDWIQSEQRTTKDGSSGSGRGNG